MARNVVAARGRLAGARGMRGGDTMIDRLRQLAQWIANDEPIQAALIFMALGCIIFAVVAR